ncbi:MAG TPA: hypothetical protein PK867_25010, partial [Pirellulales bacterium]|nr:hypothetical protein [Pirellulales bacterium]
GLVLNPSVVLFDDQGRTVFNTFPGEDGWNGRPFPVGLFRSAFIVPGDLLNDGTYEVQLYFVRDASVVVERFDALLRFQVADDTSNRRGWYGKWLGTVRPNLSWETALLEQNEPLSPSRVTERC